jgi:hypothetical protein
MRSYNNSLNPSAYVHHGFNQAYEEVKPQVRKAI